jgi:integrase
LGSIDTPRLYRKRCGTYFLRVILSTAASTSDGARRKRKEVRCSLRTKNPRRARAIAAWANARLELARSMSDRDDILKALGVEIRTWTIGPNGISAEGEDDTNNLLRVLNAHPTLPQALAAPRRAEEPVSALQQLMLDHIDRLEAQNALSAMATVPAPGTPPNPTRMTKALEEFKAKCVGDRLAEKTVFERMRLLKALVAHVTETTPGVGRDPFVHEIGAHHLSGLLDRSSTKTATDGTKTDEAASPLTQMKKVSSLRTFFSWARDERESTLTDPTSGLAKRDRALRKLAGKEREHYKPFDVAQLVKIFEPKRYLAYNNHADYFWAPLIGLHLGTRLKEIITLALADIARHEPTGVWFMDVTPENAKNRNSIRRLPIPDRLLDLGFIDYVEQLRKMGATLLFPHCNLASATGRLDPSKNCSRKFGDYLDSLGISDPGLVFHSFRHTVVTALQDAGTPLKDSMEITGHQAQQHAIRTGVISAEQAQSVHIRTYTHADKSVLHTEYPLARLKQHLDAIQVPLDYARLRRAAAIVTEHVVKTADGFKSGWSPLKQAYTDEQLLRLSKTGASAP